MAGAVQSGQTHHPSTWLHVSRKPLYEREVAAALGHSSSTLVGWCIVLSHNSRSLLQSFSSTRFEGLTVVPHWCENRDWPHFSIPAEVLEGAGRWMVFPQYHTWMVRCCGRRQFSPETWLVRRAGWTASCTPERDKIQTEPKIIGLIV